MRRNADPAWIVEQNDKIVFAGRGMSAIAEFLRRDLLWRASPSPAPSDRPYVMDPRGAHRGDEIRRDYQRAIEAQAKRTKPTAAPEPTP